MVRPTLNAYATEKRFMGNCKNRTTKRGEITGTGVKSGGGNLLPSPLILSLGLSTCVTDEGLIGVGKLKHLRYLNLSGAPVTDAGVRALFGLKSLDSLAIRSTNVSDAGISALRQSLPATSIER